MKNAPPRALFLDRDGVINIDKRYLYRIEEFVFIDGIFELATAAQAAGYLLFVITNQSGIGRGYYGEEDFQRLNRWMLERFAERGVRISAVYHCPYHPEAGLGAYRRESEDRKPGPGMIFKARDAFGVDLENSILIGDKSSDMEAARRAGIGRSILLTADPGTVISKGVETYTRLDQIRTALFESG